MTSRPDDAAEQPTAGASESLDGASTSPDVEAGAAASEASAARVDAAPTDAGRSGLDDAATAKGDATAPVTEPDAVEDADAEDGVDAEDEAEGASTRERPVTVERDDVQVRARLVPRYGRFMVLGAILGAVGGWLFSRLGSSGPWLGSGPVIDTSAVVPFLVVVGIVVGIVLGAIVAIVLDRVVGRRRRIVTAERTRHHRDDPEG